MARFFAVAKTQANFSSRLTQALCVSHMRKLNSKEAKLVDKLLKIAGRQLDIDELLVTDMNDGGMGSLAIGENYRDREFGEQVAEFIFKDLDGTFVSAVLNIDSHGNLYELDVWKVDFSPTLDLE